MPPGDAIRNLPLEVNFFHERKVTDSGFNRLS
jgi:hypothetical protein